MLPKSSPEQAGQSTSHRESASSRSRSLILYSAPVAPAAMANLLLLCRDASLVSLTPAQTKSARTWP